MNPQHHSQRESATLQSVFRPVLNALGELIQRLENRCATNGQVHELQALLDALPLSSDEFGLACNRLRNAHRYLLAREPGAAKWELNALKRSLQASGNTESPERGC